MKKLFAITVLLSLIGCIRLAGQDVPMLVAGKVHISGPLYSQGAVHVDTVTVDSAMIDIDNGIGGAQAILTTDTIIFYSNDTFEGLLRNWNDAGQPGVVAGGVGGTKTTSPIKVIVRKAFEYNKFTYISIPFTVTPNSVLRGNTNTAFTRGQNGNYWSAEFDPQLRSLPNGWDSTKVFRYQTAAENFQPSKGYQFYYDGPKGEPVDFVTTDANAIKQLFAYGQGDVSYLMYRTANTLATQEGFDANWAFIGTTNTATFSLSQNNVVGYNGGTIYFRDTKNSQSTLNAKHNTYSEFVLGKDDIDHSTDTPLGPLFTPARILNVGPYTPFYIQGTNNVRGTKTNPISVTGTISFKSGGLLLDTISFRSSNAEEGAPDQLYFVLSSDKDNSSYDRFYLDFDDSYSESYRPVEDAIKMSTAFEDRPAVWSLQEGINNSALVVSGLPMKDNREVQMGFSVPEAGNYTISLAPLRKQDVRNVVLVDNVTGKKVDLIQEGYYSFNTGAIEGENGRFVLYINSAYTGTPTINASDPYAYAKDNILTVKNLTVGDRVQVMDLAGRTISTGTASGNEFSTAVSQKGIYVVNVKGEKTSVLKVLNK